MKNYKSIEGCTKNKKTHMIEFEEKNKDAERMIVGLKNQFLEVEGMKTI